MPNALHEQAGRGEVTVEFAPPALGRYAVIYTDRLGQAWEVVNIDGTLVTVPFNRNIAFVATWIDAARAAGLEKQDGAK